MKYRRSANSRYDKKKFTRTAGKAHPKNFPTVMRGGYRM